MSPDPRTRHDAAACDRARAAAAGQHRRGADDPPPRSWLDEPTSALNPELAEHLLATVERLARDHGVAVVMVTHRLAEARHARGMTELVLHVEPWYDPRYLILAGQSPLLAVRYQIIVAIMLAGATALTTVIVVPG